uniref:Glycine rich superfamily member n=1 Tax=Rhipicephalus zambeziensis TaxID=60191 RepID=A0A224Y3W3_9ACAR
MGLGAPRRFPGDLRLISEPTSRLPVSDAVYIGVVRQRLVPAPYRVPHPVPVPQPFPVPQPYQVDVPVPKPVEVPVPRPEPIHTVTEVTNTAVVQPVTSAVVHHEGPQVTGQVQEHVAI